MDESMKNLIPVAFTIDNEIVTEDDRFLAITIDVLHTGLNFNGSIFDREVVDACAGSIANTPILGFIAKNPDGENDFQGHEYKTIVTSDGKKVVYAGHAYGVIPENCNPRWITKACSDGVEREFFRVDGLLWTKFDEAVSIFEDAGGKPQSMELKISSITGDEMDDGTFKFTGFKFDGCCLLSSTDESIEPAMIDSIAVPTFTVGTFAQEIKQKLDEYSKIKESKKKEGEEMPNGSFTLTMNEQYDEIRALLDEHTFRDRWGYECGQYYLVDIQENELIVYDRRDHYRLYGIAFTVDGDKITINFESCKRKKTQYLDYEGQETNGEDTGIFDFEKVVSEVADYVQGQLDIVTEQKNAAEQNYTEVKGDYDKIKPEYDRYVKEEADRQAEAIEAAKTAEFAKFDAHLSDNEKYMEMKTNRDDYALEDIQRECAVLFTEKSLNSAFAKKPGKDQAMTAGVVNEKKDIEISDRYGAMPTK